MLEKHDTWSHVFDPTFEVSATDISCLIERVADTLIKQLPRETAQVSSEYSTAVEFWTITDRLTGNQANEHSDYLASFS